MLKIDEATLQQILRTYGKPQPSASDKTPLSKANTQRPGDSFGTTIDREFETAGYDNKGNVRTNSDQKKALIDFFQ